MGEDAATQLCWQADELKCNAALSKQLADLESAIGRGRHCCKPVAASSLRGRTCSHSDACGGVVRCSASLPRSSTSLQKFQTGKPKFGPRARPNHARVPLPRRSCTPSIVTLALAETSQDVPRRAHGDITRFRAHIVVAQRPIDLIVAVLVLLNAAIGADMFPPFCNTKKHSITNATDGDRRLLLISNRVQESSSKQGPVVAGELQWSCSLHL